MRREVYTERSRSESLNEFTLSAVEVCNNSNIFVDVIVSAKNIKE